MTNYATIETKAAPLSGEFGVSYAARLFGEAALAGLPVYTRGARKGQPKAWLVWEKCTRGGWVGGRGVVTPGFVSARIEVDRKTVPGLTTIYPCHTKREAAAVAERENGVRHLREERDEGEKLLDKLTRFPDLADTAAKQRLDIALLNARIAAGYR